MRLLASTIVLLGALAASMPASAQTYDPRYPICMQVFGERMGDRIDCNFTSIAQCQATASGLPAMCLVNPYYAHAGIVAPARRHTSR